MSDLLKSLGATEQRQPKPQGSYNVLTQAPEVDMSDVEARSSILAEIANAGNKLTGIDKDLIIENPGAFKTAYKGQDGKNISDVSLLQELKETLNYSTERWAIYSNLGRNGDSPELMKAREALRAKNPEYQEKADKEFFDYASERWNKGKEGTGTDLERAHAEGGLLDPELLKKFGYASIHGFAGQIPLLASGAIEGSKLSALYAAGFAAVATAGTIATGGLLPALGAVSMASAASMGAGFGAAMGSFDNYRYFLKGMTYDELTQIEDENGNKIDPQIAWVASDLIGAAGAAIETFQLAEILTGGVANKIVKGKVTTALTNMTKSAAFRNALVTSAGRAITSTAVESASETVEEITAIAGEFLAKELSNIKDGTSFEHDSIKENADRLVQTFVSSFGSFMFSSLGRVPANIAALSKEAKDARRASVEKAEVVAFEDKPAAEQDELRAFFKEKVQPAFKDMDDDKMSVALRLVEEHAKAEGMKPQEWWDSRIADVIQSDDATLDALMQGDQALFQPEVYHGSPHSFDQFSTDAIGTGEGVQAFGWGLYFTEEETIARGYADRVTDKAKIQSINKQLSSLAKELTQYETGQYGVYNDSKGYEIKAQYDELMKEKLTKTRNLYKVSPAQKADFDEMTWLDWDKPLPDNISETLKQGLEYDDWYAEIEALYNNNSEGALQKQGVPFSQFAEGILDPDTQSSGDRFYKDIANALGSDKEASLFLQRAGIDGIRYPANYTAGGNKDGKSNFVVFDDAAVKVQERVLFQSELDYQPKGDILISDDAFKSLHVKKDADGAEYIEHDKGYEYDSEEDRRTYEEIREQLELFKNEELPGTLYYSGVAKGRDSDRAGTTVQRQFEKTKRVELRGHVINSPKEAAELFSVYRNPNTEYFHIIFVDADNNVLAHNAMTSGLPGRAFAAEKKDMAASLFAVETRKKRLNASGYYLLHNHPSGNPLASREDLSLTDTYKNNIPGFNGHVILNGNKFGFIDKNGGQRQEEYNPKITYEIREGEQITEPSEGVRIAKEHIGERNNLYLFLDNKWRLITAEPIKTPTYENAYQAMRRNTASAVMLVTSDQAEYNKLLKVKRDEINPFLDIIIMDKQSAHHESMRSALSNRSWLNWQTKKIDKTKRGFVFEAEGAATKKAKAAVQFLDDGRAIIRASEAADFSSFIHELSHVMRREIQGEDLQTLETWLGVEDGIWKIEHEEAFAEAYENYSMTGKAPTARLQTVFEKIKEWLRGIYNTVTDTALPDDVRQVFDNLFLTKQERSVEAEISGLVGDYNNEIINTQKLITQLEEAGEAFGDATAEDQLQIDTLKTVLAKLQDEKKKIEELRQEALGFIPDDVKQIDQFWQEWQDSAEYQDWYQKKKELETQLEAVTPEAQEAGFEEFISDLIPDSKERLEGLLRNVANVSMGKSKIDKSVFATQEPIWRAAVIKSQKAGGMSEGHAKMLLARIRNNPEKWLDMFFSLTQENWGREEFEMLEQWRDAKRQEEAALKQAEIDAKAAQSEEKAKHDEEVRMRLKELSTMRERLEAAAEFDNPRTKIRILTGEFTINEILKESKKLSEETIEAVPGTVKKAYQEGKREGKEEGAKKQRDIYRGREAEKREKKKVRQYIDKLARRISKPPAMTIDFYYREAIEAIQEGIDPKFRADKTLARREKFAEFLQRHPEKSKEIPGKVKQLMQSKSLGEFTIAELEAIDAEIQTLRQQGRLKRQLEEVQRKRKLSKAKEELTAAVLQGQPPEEIRGKGKASRKKGKAKRIPQNIQVWTMRPQRMFDQLDGGANFKGKVFDYFYNRANKASDAESRQADIRKEKGHAKAKELGIDLKKLGAVIKIGDIEYTKDEVMDIYAGMQNELKREAILYGNNLTEAEAEAFIRQLSPKDIEWAEYLISEYDENYDRLRAAHVKYTNEDIGREAAYTPILRLDTDYDDNQASMARDLLERQNLKKAYAEKGFTKSRIKIGKKHQKEIRLGLTSTWMAQVGRQEHYINGAETFRDLQWMANNSDFTAAVRQVYGSETVKTVKDWVNRVANPDIYKATDGLSRISRTLRKNTAVGYLAYNMVTMGKQLPSMAYYLPDSGAAHLIKSAAQFVNPLEARKMIERAETLDPQMKHRSIERFAEEIKKADSNAYEKIIGKLGEVGMVGIYALDKVATTIGWNAVYEASLAKGMSQEEAIMEAKNATLRTQPAAAAKDVARLYSTSNEAFNWMLMFSNQLNQIYNMISYDLPMRTRLAWQGKDLSMAYQAGLTLASVGIGGGMIWVISNKRLPEDAEDVKEMIAETFINPIPVVGGDLMAALKGYYFSDDISIIKAFKGVMSRDERKIIEGLAITLGLPYIATKRAVDAVEYQDLWELVGGKP